MADRAVWNRRRFLRAELPAVICLLAFWASESQPGALKTAKAALLEQVVKVVPTDRAYRYLGEHHRDGNRLSQSAVAYRHPASREPNSIEAHVRLNNCYRALEKHEAAIAVLRRLMEVCPDYAFGYMWLACNYSDLKHYAEAIRTHEKALELEPNMATLHVRLDKTPMSRSVTTTPRSAASKRPLTSTSAVQMHTSNWPRPTSSRTERTRPESLL